jgi:hypothetical protein
MFDFILGSVLSLGTLDLPALDYESQDPFRLFVSTVETLRVCTCAAASLVTNGAYRSWSVAVVLLL